MRLTLFIDGTVPDHVRLGESLRAWCAAKANGVCRLDVRDVRQWPVGVENIPVLATPALAADTTGRLVVGDLSDLPAALAALGCPAPVA